MVRLRPRCGLPATTSTLNVNSNMVRGRPGAKETRIGIAIRFQFHYGAIKTVLFYCSEVFVTGCQFHYGAIKTMGR